MAYQFSGNTTEETAKNQPMEKIKKLSEETLRLNHMMNTMDSHLGELGNKMVSKDDISSLLPSKQLGALEKEMQNTKMRTEKEVELLREDLENALARNSKQTLESVKQQLSRLGKNLSFFLLSYLVQYNRTFR